MSAIIQFSLFPVDKGESLSEYVAESVKIIEDSGLKYKLGPMGTCIEGEYEEILKVIGDCFIKMKEHSTRVYMTMTMDYRKDKENRLEGKVESVKKKLR